MIFILMFSCFKVVTLSYWQVVVVVNKGRLEIELFQGKKKSGQSVVQPP